MGGGSAPSAPTVSKCENFNPFLDALASLDLKLSISESVIDVFTASASTGLSDYFH